MTYLLHFGFSSLTYIKKFKKCDEREFNFIERMIYLYGLAGLLSIT